MRTTVTAILVARTGGEWLDETLAALRSQTQSPDHLVAFVKGGDSRVTQQLADAGVTHIVSAQGQLPFGTAVARCIATLPQHDEHSADEWLWLLTEDSAPEPTALEHILATVQRSPSVAIAGPKLVNWDHPERIVELGQSLTQHGSRWLLRRQELDQQQYDHLDDVLGVGPAGALVRRDVWEQLQGTDPAYPVYDDMLDLSVRARLAKYRVVVAPASRVRVAQSGVAGPRVGRSRRVIRQMHTQGRISHLHRNISYAVGPLAAVMWLLLPVLALGRVAWALIREQPGWMWGELTAALRVFFRPGMLLASRRRIRAQNTLGWDAIRPLQVDRKTVRTARMIDREAILAAQNRLPRELHFVSTGGLAVVITAAVFGVLCTWWVLSSQSLVGPALAPLSDVGTLWRHTRTIEGVPADPFAWVLAVLGSITFWNPSLIVVIMVALAVPAAALGGWIWGAQLTESPAGRALIGLGWSVSPVLLGTLDSGRLPTIVLAVVLPWLLLAATRCRESWSWAGTASLLAAIALACAPVLIPAAFVFLIIGICSSVRGIGRVITIALAPLAVFAPKLIALFGDDPLSLVLDPGITPVFAAAAPWHLVLGVPDGGLALLGEWFAAWGWSGLPVSVIAGLCVAPLAALAILGLVLGNVRTTLLHAALGGVGFLTAFAATHVQLVSVGGDGVAIWAGSGVLLYWIALLGLAGQAVPLLRKFAAPAVAFSLIGVLCISAPVVLRVITGNGSVQSAETQMPAIVQAAGVVDPNQVTLVVHAQDHGQLRVREVLGAGVRLDQIRTVVQARPYGEADAQLAQLVGQLITSQDALSLQSELQRNGTKFVLLEDTGNREERALLQAAFDQQSALSNAGHTDQGLLWRVTGSNEAAATAPTDNLSQQLEGTDLSGEMLWWAQAVVLLGVLLLALPTGEVVERAEVRRTRPKRRAGGDRASRIGETQAPVAAQNSVENAVQQPPVEHTRVRELGDER